MRDQNGVMDKAAEETRQELLIEAKLPIDPKQPIFAGHFPGRPILPGVFILGLLRLSLEEAVSASLIGRGMKKVKFLKPVIPPCRLDLKGKAIRIGGKDGNLIRFEGTAEVDGETVLEGRMEYLELAER